MKSFFVVLIAGMVGWALLQPAAAAEATKFTEKVLYSFCRERNCKDGAYPEAGVIDINGTLYGTTSGGGRGAACGTKGCGTVFSLSPNTHVETVLHSFCRDLFCPDGTNPYGGLTAIMGTLYGTTTQGGFVQGCQGNGCGTVFSFDTGTGTENTVYAFCSQSGLNCTDGDFPLRDLMHVKGRIFGTTQAGGADGMGTVFTVDPKNGTEKVIYSFCSQGNCADGFNPNDLIDLNGTLYGTTLQGGSYKCDQGEGCGTAYSLDPDTGAETVLHSFGDGTDGWHPYAGLTAVDGILFGTTGGGGIAGCGGFGCGTVFSIDPSTGAETVVYSFCSRQTCADGAVPWGTLIDVNGTLYGTTSAGGGKACGGSGCGTVFSIDPGTGTERVVHSFLGGADGANPYAGLIRANGTLYGTTSAGGGTGCYGSGCGTVFALTKTR